IHRPNDLVHLTIRKPVLLPGPCRLKQCGLQHGHHTAQGRGRTPHVRRETQMREKLADRFEARTALETEHREGCRQQTREPTSAVLGFPPPRLWRAVSACDGLCKTMPTALGNPRLTGQVSYTL